MARRRINNTDSKRYFDWVETAYTDLLCARILRSDPDLYEPCAFHCQQCTEKVLKAYLLYKTHRLADGHNLTWLCKQAVKLDGRFDVWMDESTALNRYYIEARYPTDVDFSISKEHLEKIFAMAESMFHFICKEMGISFEVTIRE